MIEFIVGGVVVLISVIIGYALGKDNDRKKEKAS